MISQNDLNRSGRHLSTKFGLRKHSANDVERLCTDGQINQTSAQNTDSITSLAHIHSSRLLVDYQNDTLCYEGIDENEIIKNLAGSVVDRSTDENMSRKFSGLTPSLASNYPSRNDSKILEALRNSKKTTHDSNRSGINR